MKALCLLRKWISEVSLGSDDVHWWQWVALRNNTCIIRSQNILGFCSWFVFSKWNTIWLHVVYCTQNGWVCVPERAKCSWNGWGWIPCRAHCDNRQNEIMLVWPKLKETQSNNVQLQGVLVPIVRQTYQFTRLFKTLQTLSDPFMIIDTFRDV